MPRGGGGDAKKPVGVRLEPELYALLEQAAAAEGVSPTTHAAHLIAQALQGEAVSPSDDTKLDALLDALERIERELPARVAAELIARASAPSSPPGDSSSRRPRPAGMTLQDYLKVRLDEDAAEGES
jgi:hypothetical protein